MSVLWVLAISPALCLAGVIEHPCDCAESADCEHEADCASDPCNQTATIREESPTSPDPANAGPLACMSDVASLPVALTPSDEMAECVNRNVSRANLPYPLSDMPLRI